MEPILKFLNSKTQIIAEVALAHDGSLGAAHAYIDAASKAGADVVKFQTHIAEAESTIREPWRVKFSKQDTCRRDYWKRTAFSEEQWIELKRHADEKNILFMSSPFSEEAIDLLSRVGVSAWKIASGEAINFPLIKKAGKTGLPLIISTGLSSMAEVDTVVNFVRKETKSKFALMQCTTSYPSAPEQIGLNVLNEFRKLYECPVGLSDHSGKIFPGLAAATLGAELLEVHLTFSRDCHGPDVVASITVDELTQLCEGVRFIEKMRATAFDKDALEFKNRPLKITFGKSIVAKRSLHAGEKIDESLIAFKKPGDGLPISKLNEILGATLKVNVEADSHILMEHLDKQ